MRVGWVNHGDVYLCKICDPLWQRACHSFCEERETTLKPPFELYDRECRQQEVFHPALFKVGGVNVERMTSFRKINDAYSTSTSIHSWRGITTTTGNGKYIVLRNDNQSWQQSLFAKNLEDEMKCLEGFVKWVAGQLPLGEVGYVISPGFVRTEEAEAQSPHRDFKGYGNTELDAVETDFSPWILHCPLMNEGMELNYWPEWYLWHQRQHSSPCWLVGW
jgi:hypothetical protein